MKGESLIEVILSFALLTMLISGVGAMSANANLRTADAAARIKAVLLAQEGLEALRSIQNAEGALLEEGIYGLQFQSGKWELTLLPEVIDGFARRVTVTALGVHEKRIESSVSWESSLLGSSTLAVVTVLQSE